MIEKDNRLLFESDEEFENFCVATFVVVKQDEKGNCFIEGDYSDMYKKCIDEGKSFVIKDRDSQVYK